MSKTKIHGWISCDALSALRNDQSVPVIPVHHTYYPEPTCLIPPSTCDKVRELIAYAKPSADRYHSQLIAELLKLLPEVE